MRTHKNRYKIGDGVISAIIQPENIVVIYGKTFIKIKDLAYFNKLKNRVRTQTMVLSY